MAVIAVAVFGFVYGMPSAQAAFPGTNGKIAFSDVLASSVEVRTIAADGTTPETLTARGQNYGPAWSADGKRIAYVHETAKGYSINSMKPNGLGKTVILGTFRRRFNSPQDVSWSPDASHLAFCGLSTSTGSSRVFTVAADGTDLTNVSGEHDDCDPEWSPDGTELALDTYPPTQPRQVVVMNIDGTNRSSIAEGFSPDWSPDGSAVAFVTAPSCCSVLTDIATVAIDGTGFTDVTNTPRRYEFGPAYSPDGEEIVFSRTQRTTLDSAEDVWCAETDGTSPLRVTDTRRADELNPDWQPT